MTFGNHLEFSAVLVLEAGKISKACVFVTVVTLSQVPILMSFPIGLGLEFTQLDIQLLIDCQQSGYKNVDLPLWPKFFSSENED